MTPTHRRGAIRSHSSGAGAAALWAASGIALGAALAGLLDPWAGFAAAGSAAAAGALIWGRMPGPATIRETAARAEEIEARPSPRLDLAPAGLQDPRAALAGVLRSVAGHFGSDTVIVLSLRDGGDDLVLEAPYVAGGEVAEAGRSRRYPVGGGGSLRVALASEVPIAGRRSEHATGWDNLAEEFGIAGAALSPLRAGGAPFGILVIGFPEGRPGNSDLATVEDALVPAATAIGALLRLRDHTETSAGRARSERFRSDYTTVIGHELRTPLTTILGVLKTVTRPELAPADQDARDLLEMAADQGDRLRRLVEDMLAVSQMGDRGVPVRPELVDVPDLLERAADAVPGASDLATFAVEDGMPPVILDPEHTRRVLVNLIANAVKYGEAGPIGVSAGIEGAELVLTVADRGPGMPTGAAARAFEPYEQLARNEVDAYGGVGLGLSICRGLVEAMDGTIAYRPTDGGGATFEVRLPFKPHLRFDG